MVLVLTVQKSLSLASMALTMESVPLVGVKAFWAIPSRVISMAKAFIRLMLLL